MAVAPPGCDAQPLQRAVRQIGDAAPGRLAPAQGAAGGDRLAGDDLGHRAPLVHRIRVHEPGHDLLVGAHVGRHHVGVGADEGDHLLHVAARQVLQFMARQRVGIDGDAALRTAIGQAGQRAFPAHPDRQRGDLADVEIGRIARAALGGAECQVVLHAVAVEDPGAAVLHVDRAGDGDGTLGKQQAVPLVERDFQVVGDHLELLAGHVEYRPGIDGHRLSPGGSSGRPGWVRQPPRSGIRPIRTCTGILYAAAWRISQHIWGILRQSGGQHGAVGPWRQKRLRPDRDCSTPRLAAVRDQPARLGLSANGLPPG